MIYYKCPYCNNLYSEVLWCEETSEHRNMPMRHIVPPREANRNCKYRCPSCKGISLNANMTREVRTAKLERIMSRAFVKLNFEFKLLRGLGVLIDKTPDKKEIKKAVKKGTVEYALHINTEDVRKIEQEGELMSCTAILGRMVYFKSSSDSKIVAVLMMTYNSKTDKYNFEWHDHRGLIIQPDMVAVLNNWLNRKTKSKPIQHTEVKVFTADDCSIYISYPNTDGSMMKTVKINDLPAGAIKNMTFETLLEMLLKNQLIKV